MSSQVATTRLVGHNTNMTLTLLLTVLVQTAPGGPKTNTSTTSTAPPERTEAPSRAPMGTEVSKSPCQPRCGPTARCLETSRGPVCVAKERQRPRRRRRDQEVEATTKKARFGRRGQAAIGGGIGGSIQGTLSDGGVVDVRLGGSMRYFMSDDFPLRLLVGIQYQDADGAFSQFTGTLGAGLGYNFGLGERTSLLLEGALVFTTFDLGDSDLADATVLAAQFDVNLIVEVADHVFFGIGPQLTRYLSTKVGGQDGPNATLLGLNMQVGLMF